MNPLHKMYIALSTHLQNPSKNALILSILQSR
jgi:hypothetical protein